jgi:predicted signal transduction protein with EAL and GGDEF domain
VLPIDLVVRQGGDEFLVLIRDLPSSGRDVAEAVGQRIADAMHAPFELGAAELLVDAAIGISLFPDDAETPEALRKHADAAMYEAKAAGGGVNVYGEETVDPIARLELAARLRRGIERGELELHHQPILRLADRCAIGVESLVRWRDPARQGLVPPGEFIPVAERTGAIETLGDWVLGEVCRQAREWAERGLYPNVGFNVSPRQLRRPDVARRFAEVVNAHSIEPGRFVLEITESAWSLEASRLLPVLGELRAAGFALAIDDFRRRLLLALAAARAAGPDHQGRPRVPRRRPARPAGDSGLLRDHAAGRRLRLRRGGRGRRGRRARGVPVGERLPHRPGLPLQPPGARAGLRGAARGVDRAWAAALTNVNCAG